MAEATLPHRDAVGEFVERVEEAGLPAVERLVLFGSVARGVHTADSDVDVLAVIDDAADVAAVEERLRDIAYDVMPERGVAFSIHGVAQSVLERRGGHPFFEHVRSEGRRIYG